jgi:hypothetical protein
MSMLWSRSAPPTVPAAPAAVPDAQALRRTALHAAWRRDRRVGRRRVALRWLVWAFWRYGVPMAAVLALALAVWLWLLPATHQMLTGQTMTQAATLPQKEPPIVDSPQTADTSARPSVNAEDAAPESIRLRLASDWPVPGATPSPTLAEPAAAQTVQDPSLKPENWLHSKEP